MGFEPCTPDNLPIIGKASNLDYLNEQLLREVFFGKHNDIQSALDRALSEMGKKAKIVAVLQACKCLPTVQTKTQS